VEPELIADDYELSHDRLRVAYAARGEPDQGPELVLPERDRHHRSLRDRGDLAEPGRGSAAASERLQRDGCGVSSTAAARAGLTQETRPD